jgi:hypothetical protein
LIARGNGRQDALLHKLYHLIQKSVERTK